MSHAAWTGGSAQAQADAETLERFQNMGNPNDPERAELIAQMKEHTEKLARQRQHEDPRLSFSTPEYKEASRRFSERFKKNFDQPITYGLVKRYPWSDPILMELKVPLDVDGNPWPLDDNGKPILKEAQ